MTKNAKTLKRLNQVWHEIEYSVQPFVEAVIAEKQGEDRPESVAQ